MQRPSRYASARLHGGVEEGPVGGVRTGRVSWVGGWGLQLGDVIGNRNLTILVYQVGWVVSRQAYRAFCLARFSFPLFDSEAWMTLRLQIGLESA
jgi:hypothetical protein